MEQQQVFSSLIKLRAMHKFFHHQNDFVDRQSSYIDLRELERNQWIEVVKLY